MSVALAYPLAAAAGVCGLAVVHRCRAAAACSHREPSSILAFDGRDIAHELRQCSNSSTPDRI